MQTYNMTLVLKSIHYMRAQSITDLISIVTQLPKYIKDKCANVSMSGAVVTYKNIHFPQNCESIKLLL